MYVICQSLFRFLCEIITYYIKENTQCLNKIVLRIDNVYSLLPTLNFICKNATV